MRRLRTRRAGGGFVDLPADPLHCVTMRILPKRPTVPGSSRLRAAGRGMRRWSNPSAGGVRVLPPLSNFLSSR